MALAPHIDSRWIWQRLRRPWSLDKAFIVGMGCGAIAPAVEALLITRFGIETGNLLFLGASLALMLSLYWMLSSRTAEPHRRTLAAVLGLGAVWLLSVGASVWCYTSHVCTEGHMQHAPYPAWHYLADCAWAGGILMFPLSLRKSGSRLCVGLAVLSAYWVSYRFAFSSFGGLYLSVPF